MLFLFCFWWKSIQLSIVVVIVLGYDYGNIGDDWDAWESCTEEDEESDEQDPIEEEPPEAAAMELLDFSFKEIDEYLNMDGPPEIWRR